MQNISIAVDPLATAIAVLIACLAFLFSRWSKLYAQPHIKFSDLQSLSPIQSGLKQKFNRLPFTFFLATLIFFAAAFIDIHYFAKKIEKENGQRANRQDSIPTEGIAMYLALDKSGSMSQRMSAPASLANRAQLTKMEHLKQVTQAFIEKRSNDLIGLLTFARGAQVLAPLTLDHNAILEAVDQLSYTTRPEQDGTAIGYAIYKTANLIAATKHYARQIKGEKRPAYEIKNTIMVLVTDGFQSPNPLDRGKRLRNIGLIDAAEYARANGIKIYVISVEPRLAEAEFDVYRGQLTQVAQITGGHFYLIQNPEELDDMYARIDLLEKSKLPPQARIATARKSDVPKLYGRVSFYPYLIAAGMLCLGLAVVLETLILRSLP